MKADFASRLLRISDEQYKTVCKRCNAEIHIRMEAVVGATKVICKGCSNEGVPTTFSVIWKHTSGDMLVDGIASVEPKFPKRKEKPVSPYDKKQLTSTMLFAHKNSKEFVDGLFSDANVSEIPTWPAEIPEKQKSELLKKEWSRPIWHKRVPKNSVENQKLIDEYVADIRKYCSIDMASEKVVTGITFVNEKEERNNKAYKYVGAKHSGYIARCLYCDRSMLVAELEENPQNFSCTYCETTAKIKDKLEGEFGDWPRTIEVDWARGAKAVSKSCYLCSRAISKVRSSPYVRTCEACNDIHWVGLRLGAYAKDFKILRGTISRDIGQEIPEEKEGDYPGPEESHFANCPFCEELVWLSGDVLEDGRGKAFGCCCGSSVWIPECFEDFSEINTIDAVWTMSREDYKKLPTKEKSSEVFSFETASELLEMFRKK